MNLPTTNWFVLAVSSILTALFLAFLVQAPLLRLSLALLIRIRALGILSKHIAIATWSVIQQWSQWVELARQEAHSITAEAPEKPEEAHEQQHEQQSILSVP